MKRDFLFLIDPIHGLLPDKDTSLALMLAATRREHTVHTATIDTLSIRSGRPAARTRATTLRSLTGVTPDCDLGPSGVRFLDEFQVVLMRKDPPVDAAFLYATHVLGLVDPGRTLVTNSPTGIRVANEKLYALHFPEVMPESCVTASVAELHAFLREMGGRMILKPLDGCGGAGIFLAAARDRNLASLLEQSTANGTRAVMAQRYLPAARRGDKRILLLNGEPLGAILRVPRAEDHRGNIHVGGRVEPTTLSRQDERVVAAVADRLRRDGLHFVGLDVIGGLLTEVNVTSPTGLQEMGRFAGRDLATPVIDFLEGRVPRR